MQNILDSPIPETKIPLVPPIRPTKSTSNPKPRIIKKIQEELKNFSEWLLPLIRPKIRSRVEVKIAKLKKRIKVIYRRAEKENTLKKSSFDSYLKEHRILGGNDDVDPSIFMKKQEKRVLETISITKKPTKIKFYLTCEFHKIGNDGQEVSTEGHFHTVPEIVTKSTNLINLYEKISEDILERVAEFQNEGSGWVIRKVVSLSIHFAKYEPLRGSTYIPLPQELARREAIINPQNKDDQCFKWAVTIARFTPKHHPQRISGALKENAEKLNWEGLRFPLELRDIKIFEKNNKDYAISVLGYEKGGFEPLRIYEGEIREHNIILLLISNEKTKHYCWIKNISRLLSSQLSNHQHKRHFCLRCLNSFTNEYVLRDHSEWCGQHKSVKVTVPPKGTALQFKNHPRSMKVPFVIYADFECILEKVASCSSDPKRSSTEPCQKHKPSGYCYVIKYDENALPPKIVKYTAQSEEEDLGEHFMRSIEEDVLFLYKKLSEKKKMVMTDLDRKEYEEAKHCHICKEELGRDKVRDHNHLTGKFRGAAHNKCNLQYKLPNFIPIFFHNLSGYDAHLFVKALGISKGKIKCIAKNEEQYISFSKGIIVDHYADKEGKIHDLFLEARFLDSYKFMSSSLSNLINNLTKDQFEVISSFYGGEHLNLLMRKGVYPYEYVDSLTKLEEPHLPPLKAFHSDLNDSDITREDYEHAQEVWKTFDMKTMKDYHDLYLQTDVLLLADVFENFRIVCRRYYDLDPAWYYTAPGLAWDAMLKITNIRLELLSDIDMILMMESGIRGGIASVGSKRYAKANNKYMKNYDRKEKSTYIPYWDANNLYGWSMSQSLPTNGFKWMNEKKLEKWRRIPCILDVDLKYPQELHNLHNDYPLAPEHLKAKSGVMKLIPNFYDKSHYVVHHDTLKFYESQGLRITKIHRGISFEESPWLKKYIDLNTDLRTNATNDFEKDFFKLMNNSVFGKTMENIRNRRDIRLVTNEKQANKLTRKPNFIGAKSFSEKLAAIHMRRTHLEYNKPIYLGMSILDLSKKFMYDFHYNYVKKKYNYKVTLLYTDTDSLIYEIQTHDLYKDIEGDIERLFDTSNYPKDHAGIKKRVNKKVRGMMKDETAGKQVTEFVTLRAKLYSFRTEGGREEKKCKGVKRCVVENSIRFPHYKDCLFSGEELMRTMRVFRSRSHEITSEKVNKIALSSRDDKRVILRGDPITTLAHGHYMNNL